MNYPGYIVRLGEPPGRVFSAIQKMLALRGYPKVMESVSFDANVAGLVELFQSQHFGPMGQTLHIDGEVGPLTWAALFGLPQLPAGSASPLSLRALEIANSQLGNREQPLGSNRGPEIDEYLKSAGSSPGNYWCMAFIYWCFLNAAESLGIKNPFPRTAGCIDAWNKTSKANRLSKLNAQKKPNLVAPGMVFIHAYKAGAGHTGIIVQNINGNLETIEGNTDPKGGSNGLAVLFLRRRTIMDTSLVGFLVF